MGSPDPPMPFAGAAAAALCSIRLTRRTFSIDKLKHRTSRVGDRNHQGCLPPPRPERPLLIDGILEPYAAMCLCVNKHI